MQQVDKDEPPFLSIIVPKSYDKVSKNPAYPSCTVRDVDPFMCGQFYLCYLIFRTMQVNYKTTSFLYPTIISNSLWG